MPAYTIKSLSRTQLTPARLQRLTALFRQLDAAEMGYDGKYGLQMVPATEQGTKEWLQQRKDGVTAAVDGRGHILGFATNSPSREYKDTNVISAFTVDEKHRGKGIGRALLQDIIRRNRSQKRRSLLRVSLNNPAGLHLYGSLGFKPINQTMVLDAGQEKTAAQDPQAQRIGAYALNAAKDVLDDPARHAAVTADEQAFANHPVDWTPVDQLKREGYFPGKARIEFLPHVGSKILGGGYTPGDRMRPHPTIYLPTNGAGQVSRSMAAHEAGHERDYERLVRSGQIPTNSVNQLKRFNDCYGVGNDPMDPEGGVSRRPFVDYLRGKTGFLARERAGWDQATGRYDPKVRDLALKTYENAARLGYDLDYVGEIERPFKDRRMSIVDEDGYPPDLLQKARAPLATVKRYMSTHGSGDAVKHLRALMDRARNTQFQYRTGGQR